MTPIISVLAADKTHARFFQKTGKKGPLNEIETWTQTEGRLQERDLASNRPGRSFDRMGEGRHAMEPRTSPKQHQAEEFAKYIADQLQRYDTDHKIDKLVILAAPEFLGMIRQELKQEIRRKVIHEVDKDTTREDAAAIDERLQALLAG